MKTNMDKLMIKICALLFVMACVFAVDCYMQYKNIVSIHKSSSKLSTYAAVAQLR